jgi:hypothetical protein
MLNVGEKCVQKIKTRNFCSILFSPQKPEYAEKFHITVQATDGNMAHAHCMLDT